MDDSRLTELILDMNDLPIPQYYSEDDEEYAAETTDGSLVLASSYDFRLTELLLDMNGFPIPQLWDPVAEEFVPRTVQGGGGGGDDYVLPVATTTVLGGVKSDGTTVEIDANGVLSVKEDTFIEPALLVRSVNFAIPDPLTGNVELPPPLPGEYRYSDPLPPTDGEDEYDMGTTAFITYFERSTMPDWATSFNNPNVPDGDMMVVTYKYENGQMHCIQLVDTFQDGVFKAQFSRQWDYTNDEWTSLQEIAFVQSVNGIKPNMSGNVSIPNATTAVPGLVRPDNTTITVSSGVLTANQTGLVKKVEGLSPDANGNVDIPVTSTTRYGKVMMNDTLVGTSASQALTANQGRVLKGLYDTHVATKASETAYGHVKVDGETIIATDGVISLVPQGIPVASYDFLGIAQPINIANPPATMHTYMYLTAKDTLDVLQNMDLEINGHLSKEATTGQMGHVQLASGHSTAQNTRVPTVAVMNTAINQHANTAATTGARGHVRVDGATVTIDANAVISVPTATTSQKGIVQIDGTSLLIDASGVTSWNRTGYTISKLHHAATLEADLLSVKIATSTLSENTIRASAEIYDSGLFLDKSQYTINKVGNDVIISFGSALTRDRKLVMVLNEIIQK